MSDRSQLVEMAFTIGRARAFAMKNALNAIEAILSFELDADTLRFEIKKELDKCNETLNQIRLCNPANL